MNTYELTFVVASLTEELAEHLYDLDLDVFVGHDFDGRPYVTVSVQGRTAIDAGKAMLTRLHTLGLEVKFVQHDLVTRTEIAARLEVSRAAVGQWVSGKRGASTSTPFPPAFSDTAGGVWLWGDVARWANDTGRSDEGMSYPTRSELDKLNAYIRSGCVPEHAPTQVVKDFAVVEQRSHVWAGHITFKESVAEDIETTRRRLAAVTRR